MRCMAGPVAGGIGSIEQGCDRLGQIGVTGSPGPAGRFPRYVADLFGVAAHL